MTADPKRALCWRTRDEGGGAVPIERGGGCPHVWERGRDLTLCSDATAYEVVASVGAAFAVIFRSFGSACTAASGGPAVHVQPPVAGRRGQLGPLCRPKHTRKCTLSRKYDNKVVPQ